MEKANSHLVGHLIDSFLRAKLIDWFVNVFSLMGLQTRTFFITVNILDLYLKYSQLEKDWISKDDLYLIGICAIFIAIKYEETWKVEIGII